MALVTPCRPVVSSADGVVLTGDLSGDGAGGEILHLCGRWVLRISALI